MSHTRDTLGLDLPSNDRALDVPGDFFDASPRPRPVLVATSSGPAPSTLLTEPEAPARKVLSLPDWLHKRRLNEPPPAPPMSLAMAAMAAIQGGQDAQRLLFALSDGCAPADMLFDGLQAVLATGDVVRLRGFTREIQKRLERGA